MFRYTILAVFLSVCFLLLTASDAFSAFEENVHHESYLYQPLLSVHTYPPPETTITISFAGDCTIGTDISFPYENSFPYQLEMNNNDYGYFFRSVKPIFEEDDLTIVNLETTLTRAAAPAEKKYRFRGDPSYVNILKEGSIEIVNISNNHIYDYKEEGYTETLETLEKAGILYSGEGHTAIVNIKGITVASLGYTGWDTSIKKRMASDIQKARDKAELVIVSLHWGEERSFCPNNTQLELGRFCIDRGADIVIGHHPHVIQGIEKYKNRYIVYSLGNFCFGGNRNPSDKDTFIFQYNATFRDNCITDTRVSIIPCSISSVNYTNDYQPTVLKGGAKHRILNRILEYSSLLKYGISGTLPN